MGGDICCSDANKNNQSVHVYQFIIKNHSFYSWVITLEIEKKEIL